MSVSGRGGRAVLRHRDFRFYLAGRFLWALALQMQTLAIAWLVYDLTHNPLSLGFIGLFAFLPALPLSLVTGAVADRYDRRRVLLLTYVLMIGGLAAFLALAGTTRAWPAYGLVAIIGAARAFSNPASQSLMTNLIPSDEYSGAAAWANTFNQSATILGPSAGGLLYPLGAWVPFATALAFMIMALAFTMLIAPRPRTSGGKPRVTLASLVAGYRFIWISPAILGAITLDLVAVLLGGATALLPVFASEVYHAGPWGLGLLRSSPAAGSIVAAMVVAHSPLSRGVGKIMFGAVIVYGAATIAFGLSTNMLLGMACLAILGAADVVSVVIRQSLIQIDTPDEMRGRVVAVHNILTNASNNLGDFESGALASLVGAPLTVVFGGGCAIIASLFWMRVFPGLSERERL